MKIKQLIAILSTGVFILTGYFANAQYDPDAKKILDKVSEKYKGFKSYKADFKYSMHNPQSSINEDMKGDVIVKGSKYVINMGNQKIYNNGKTVWTYNKEVGEVNVSDYKPNEEEITPTNIYTLYKDGFKYLINQSKTKEAAEGYKVIDLVPEDKSKSFFKIRLTLNTNNHTIDKWKIFEKSGSRYVWDITNFKPDIQIKNSAFKFDKSKHKDVDVIDLR